MARIKKTSKTNGYTAYAKGGGKVPKTPAQKKFAALAPPKNKITFADKIAGAKKKTKSSSTAKMKKGGRMKQCRGGCY